jgi:glycerol kinase
LSNIKINRPKLVETTALGAAYLAGLEVGFWKSPEIVERLRATGKVFKPKMKEAERKKLWVGWKKAVSRVLTREKAWGGKGL